MKRLILLLVMIASAAMAVSMTQKTSAEETPSNIETAVAQPLPDKVDIKNNGRIWVNGKRITVTLLYDGTQLPLRSEHILASAGKNPGFYISIYPDGLSSDQTLTKRIVVVDSAGKNVRLSNALDTGLEFEWGDNNYVQFDNGAMYFGIYSPKRMQFVYRDGKLEENTGPWRGPAKPEKYIEPEHPGPCYNVADVPACIKEVEQAEAAKRAKRKHKAKPAVSTPVPSTSQ